MKHKAPNSSWTRDFLLRCRSSGVELGQPEAETFERYLELISDWNTKANIVSRRSEDTAKNFIDSLLVASHIPIPRASDVMDIGSGAGFPGVPLKIIRPDIKLVLVDSKRKKILFLKNLCQEIHIEANILHMRAEDLNRDPAHVASYDLLLARGVGSILRVSELGLPFLRQGGTLATYKGRALSAELEEFLSSPLTALLHDPQVISLSRTGGRGYLVALKREAN